MQIRAARSAFLVDVFFGGVGKCGGRGGVILSNAYRLLCQEGCIRFVISTGVIEGAKRADHVAEKSSAARYTFCLKASNCNSLHELLIRRAI